MKPELSAIPVPGPWAERVNSRNDLRVDYENGGESLGVVSNSNAFEWMAQSNGESVWVSRADVAPVLILIDTNITEVALAFDQAMNAHIAFVADGVAKFRWWNSLAGAYETMVLAGCRTPRCCSDEKHPLLSGDRDLILTYMKGDELCVRLQRDRYTVEYVKVPLDGETAEQMTESTRIVSFGMNSGRRLQWRLA